MSNPENLNFRNIITDSNGAITFEVDANNVRTSLPINANGDIKGKVNPDYSDEYDPLNFVYTDGRISSTNGSVILPQFQVGGDISAPKGSVEVQEINGSRTNVDVIAGKDISIQTANMSQRFSEYESNYNLNIVSSEGIISIGELKSVNDTSLRHLNNANLQSTKAVVIGKLENNSWQGINVDSPILVLPKSEDGKALIPPPNEFVGKVVYATEAEIKNEAKLKATIDTELVERTNSIQQAQERLKDKPEYHQSILDQIGKVPAIEPLNVTIDRAINAQSHSLPSCTTVASGESAGTVRR